MGTARGGRSQVSRPGFGYGMLVNPLPSGPQAAEGGENQGMVAGRLAAQWAYQLVRLTHGRALPPHADSAGKSLLELELAPQAVLLMQPEDD